MSKRKHSERAEKYFHDDSPSVSEDPQNDFDISSALINKRVKTLLSVQEKDDDDDDDDLADFIQSSIAKRFVKEGAQVVKKAKGKKKITKGEVGGGSFQSMGRFLASFRKAAFSVTTCRLASIFAQVSYTSRVQNTYTYPKNGYTGPSHESSKGPCWHGSYWFRKVSCFSSPSRPAFGRPTLNVFRSQSFNIAPYT